MHAVDVSQSVLLGGISKAVWKEAVCLVMQLRATVARKTDDGCIDLL